ncbi:MAG: hypothetical protein HQL52_03945 [Magnetococcales bacterium]|nr:hypothetical protein [Magnetococcales bacterium]
MSQKVIIIDPQNQPASEVWEWSEPELKRQMTKLRPPTTQHAATPALTEPFSILDGHTVVPVQLTEDPHDPELEALGGLAVTVMMEEVVKRDEKGEPIKDADGNDETYTRPASATATRKSKPKPLADVKAALATRLEAKALAKMQEAFTGKQRLLDACGLLEPAEAATLKAATADIWTICQAAKPDIENATTRRQAKSLYRAALAAWSE